MGLTFAPIRPGLMPARTLARFMPRDRARNRIAVNAVGTRTRNLEVRTSLAAPRQF
jgi:hypothetical protein